MRSLSITLLTLVAVCSITGYSGAYDIGREAVGKGGMVTSGRAQATEAGLRILEEGGNAADAATATLLMITLKHPGAASFGGETPLIVYDAVKGETKVLSGPGEAPLDPKAIDWYMANGIPGGIMKGSLVPGTPDLLFTLLRLYGSMSFEQVSAPMREALAAGGPDWYVDSASRDTIRLDRRETKGKSFYEAFGGTINKLVEAERRKKGSREEKIQAIADRFYRGDIADDLEKWYIEKDGFLRKRDLAEHVTEVEDPVTVNYHGYTVCKCGPWTQGPYVLQTLRILEGYDLKKIGLASADYVHVVTEAMKLAFADRDEYYGDPLFVKVPMDELLSDQYSLIRQPLIDMEHASLEVRPGNPYTMEPVKEGGRFIPGQSGTTVCCVADRYGNVVVATPSGLSTTAGFGGVTGVIHNSRLVSLNTWKGHPNVIEPGKRPRITLTPTLVLKDGKPVLAISVAGGDLQDQAAIQLLVDYIDFGLMPAEAMKVPRFATRHHFSSFGGSRPRLGDLRVQETVGYHVIEELKKRGHQLTSSPRGVGGAAIIAIDRDTGTMYSAGGNCGGLD